MTDADGQMTVTEIASRPLVQDLLKHDVSWCNIALLKNATMKLGVVVRLVG